MNNPFAKIDPVKMLNPNINQEALKYEIENNPLIKLQMSDQNMVAELNRNPDPKQAEMLMKRKLESIGLNPKEVTVMLMRDGMKYPLQRAMSETGLSQEELDKLYDETVVKINNAINGTGILGNVSTIFGK